MGLLDSLEGMAGLGGGQHQQVAQALAQTVEEHPGGLGGLLNQFKQNGLQQHVDSWTGPGENQPVSPDQVEQGMGGGLLNTVAQRAGLSPEMTKIALATVLPIVVSHFSQQGGGLGSGGLGGIAGKIFGNR